MNTTTNDNEISNPSLLNDRPHILYRMFDHDDRLLYIGITVDVPNRLHGHREEKNWWATIVTIRLEHFPDRYTVLRAERKAIQAEQPIFNTLFTTRRRGPDCLPIAVRLDPELRERLDDFCLRTRRNLTNAVSLFVEDGLDAWEKGERSAT